MPLLNYTTEVGADRTVEQIQKILVKHGAKSILINYDGEGAAESLSFIVNTLYGERGIKLPIHPGAVLAVLLKQVGVPRRYCNRPQAVRVAWRIVKDWVESQMAILETEMVTLDQIFLPYMLTPSGKTLYEHLVDTRFQLTSGEVSQRE